MHCQKTFIFHPVTSFRESNRKQGLNLCIPALSVLVKHTRVMSNWVNGVHQNIGFDKILSRIRENVYRNILNDHELKYKTAVQLCISVYMANCGQK